MVKKLSVDSLLCSTLVLCAPLCHAMVTGPGEETILAAALGFVGVVALICVVIAYAPLIFYCLTMQRLCDSLMVIMGRARVWFGLC